MGYARYVLSRDATIGDKAYFDKDRDASDGEG